MHDFSPGLAAGDQIQKVQAVPADDTKLELVGMGKAI